MTGLRGGCPSWVAKAGSGGPTTLIASPPGLRTVRDFSRLAAAEGVEDDVVAAEDVGEVLLGEVDDLVGAERRGPCPGP